MYQSPPKEITSPAKESHLKLKSKYYTKCTELLVTKQRWFSRKLIQYNTWSITEFQKLMRVAHRIIRKHN